MSKECDHNCGECSADCGERDKTDFREKLNELSKVKKVVGIVSGKGGVGKSIVTSMLSVLMNRNGYKTAILDADITGPSIPKAFGIKGKADACESGLYPVKSKMGIKIMSTNLLLEKDTDPVIWRGPMIAGMVKQFWSDVIWDQIDIMFIDMPPGTGDVPLTVFQSLPLTE
jgi:Mrp family chromosome partitioning ATPase